MKTLSIKGLPDTYSFLQEDTSLSKRGYAADAQATGDAIAQLKEVAERADHQSSTVATECTNLYDKTTRKVDTGLSSSGEEVSKTGWDVSDFVPVTEGKIYIAKVWNNNAWAVAPLTNSTGTLYVIYDADKQYLTSGLASLLTSNGVTMPASAAYIRVMCRKNTIETAPETLVIAEKERFPDTYVAYGDTIIYYMRDMVHDIAGTDVTIVGESGHRYRCGTLSTLDFTPCADGLCLVRFTSGTSVTVLTVHGDIQWPSWFNPELLETNTTYELIVSDGKLGVVGTWS
jgi:hypothetical protein